MWGWDAGLTGYCGETSIQSSALLYGNWISQERVRNAGGGEIVVGINAHTAARALRLTFTEWAFTSAPQPQPTGYLAWVRGHVDAGHPVIAGVYMAVMNDSDYDHEVAIIGYDAGGLYYNDWYQATPRYLPLPASIKSRAQCRGVGDQPYEYCLPSLVDYGMAVTGVRDPRGELRPISLSVGRWDEPDWGVEDRLNEPLVTLRPVVTARGLTPGVTYALLRFDTAASLPSAGGFLAAAWSEKVTFTATGTSASVSSLGTISSGGTYFYRCVVAA